MSLWFWTQTLQELLDLGPDIRNTDPQAWLAVLRIRDVYPGSWFLPIPDPGSKNSNKRERWKKISCHTFLCSHKFHKIVNYFSFEVLKKKIFGPIFKELKNFYQKNCQKALKNMVLGSGIRDPGSRKNLFRIPDPDPQHCWLALLRLRYGTCGTQTRIQQTIRFQFPLLE